MVDVFISYSRDNKARVADIAAAVTAAGYAVWWDAELPPHRSYGDVITEKIGSAKAAIVVWSHASAQSEWVRAEADVARNQKKLVQTAIDDVMPPLQFNQIQFADLGDWRGEADHRGWRKVLMSLEELCGRAADPAPVASPPPVSSVRDTARPEAARKPSMLPWALLGVAVLALALLAWKLLQPPVGGDAAADPAAAAVAAGDAAPAATVPTAHEAFTLAAVIDDPDGFTNIRSEPGTAAAIVGKVLKDETFLTYDQPGSWWRVRKADGTTGFMFRKYIRLVERGEAASTAPGTPPHAAPAEGAIIADSTTRALGPADIDGLTAEQLRLARNEIFARRGLRFRDPTLQSHFGQFAWYRPARDTVDLSPVEKANVDFLKAAEAAAP